MTKNCHNFQNIKKLCFMRISLLFTVIHQTFVSIFQLLNPLSLYQDLEFLNVFVLT